MLEIWNSSYVIEKIINISNLKFKLVVVVKMPVLQHSSMAFWWQTPMFFLRASNLSFGKDFVNISDNCSSDEQWTSNTSLDCCTSLRKWNLILMCLVRPWKTGFFAIETADILSHIILVGSVCSNPKSSSNFLNQIAWFTAEAAAMYSASAVDWAVVSCFFWTLSEISSP